MRRLALLVVLLSACASQPRTTYRLVRTLPRDHDRAVQALVVGTGDVEDLAHAGGVVIGEVVAQAKDANDDELAAQAQSEATKRGGSHLVWVGDASRVDESPNLAAAFASAYSGQACDRGSGRACVDYANQTNAAPIKTHVAGGRFVVFRVPVESWPTLRPELRPALRDAKVEEEERRVEASYQACRKGSLNPDMCKRGEKLPTDDQPHPAVRVEQLRAVDALGELLRPCLREPREVAPLPVFAADVNVGRRDDRHGPPGHLAVAQRGRGARHLVEARHLGDRRLPRVLHKRRPGHDDRGRRAVRHALDVLASVVAHAQRQLGELVRHEPRQVASLEAPPDVDHAVVELGAVWAVHVRPDHREAQLLGEPHRPRRVFGVNTGTVVNPRGDVVGVQARASCPARRDMDQLRREGPVS